MKKSIIILNMLKPGDKTAANGLWGRLRKYTLSMGVVTGVLSFLCICVSLELTACVVALICLVCLWVSDE